MQLSWHHSLPSSHLTLLVRLPFSTLTSMPVRRAVVAQILSSAFTLCADAKVGAEGHGAKQSRSSWGTWPVVLINRVVVIGICGWSAGGVGDAAVRVVDRSSYCSAGIVRCG